MASPEKINRRTFLGSAAAASVAFTVVPRHVLGGGGMVPPSDKLNIGYIGCGTQGIREMATLITDPAIHIAAVCDPNKFTTDYVDWSLNGIRDIIRRTLEEPQWGDKLKGIPGGRDIGREFVEKFYAKQRNAGSYNGCPSYIDFRELLEKERDIDVIKIMTPDHLHATIAIASMKKGIQVITHKPIANRMYEAKLTIETARNTGVGTHLLAWNVKPGYNLIRDWIRGGFIGNLKEIHNWSNRPVWPQWQANPTDTPPVPKGFDWSLWLGPVPERPYHPHFTHAVFRGWYDFGGGSIADMGHYSLFPLFMTLGINTPAYSAEAYGTTTRILDNNVATSVKNEVAFPLSCIIRFQFAAQEELPPFELIWYDGGMKPMVPDEMRTEGKSLKPEGMMFVGDKGKIVADFGGDNPVLVPESKMEFLKTVTTEVSGARTNSAWIEAFKNKTRSPGSFLNAGPVTETIILGSVALRAGQRVQYDSANMKITNFPEANKFLTREYRPGWEL